MFKIRLRNRLGLKVELQSSTDLAKTLVEIWTRGPRCTGAFRIGRLTVMWLTQPPLWLVGAYWDVREYVEEQLPTWRRRLSRNAIVRLLLGLRYTVAVYSVYRSYGGPEEGGWYYDCGDLVRTVKRFRSENEAWDYCNRLNDKLYGHDHVRLRKDIYRAKVYDSTAPDSFPSERPYYC
jgi:hypothetical protein